MAPHKQQRSNAPFKICLSNAILYTIYSHAGSSSAMLSNNTRSISNLTTGTWTENEWMKYDEFL